MRTLPFKGQARPLYEIADDIKAHWKKISPHAEPYLQAMNHLSSIEDNYGYDEGIAVVLYFLSNATYWRGPDAKRIKAELNALVKEYQHE